MKRPLLAACLAIVCIIGIYYFIFPPALPAAAPAEGEKVFLYGRIDRKESRIFYGKEQFILYLSDVSVFDSETALKSGQEISSDNKWNQIMCYVLPNQCKLRSGSFVLLCGKPEDFRRPTNPGEFDSRLYYRSVGIDFCVKSAEILWESASYSRAKEFLQKVRMLGEARLDYVLEERYASVLKTMLLGNKRALDEEVKGLYQENGIAHILAISGLHISLLGMGLYGGLRKTGVPIWLAAPVCIIGILAYGELVGAGVSALRAIGMFLIRMVAEILGRSYDMLTALGVLMLFMVLGQPLYLFHSGFLLSFSSLFGIGLLYPALERGRKEKREGALVYREGWKKRIYGAKEWLCKSFWVSFSVTVANLPVTLWYFYEVPVYSVLLNLVVIPFMTVLMYLGIGLLIIPAGGWLKAPALCVEGILWLYETLCRGSENLPGHTWILGRPKMWQMILFVILVWGIMQKGIWQKKEKYLRWLDLRKGLLVVAVFVICARVPENFQITFLDVGQGDGICIRTERGKTYLVDCGSSSKSEVGKYTLAPFLKCQGVREIEAVFITHPDEDHFSGLAGLLEEGYGRRIKRLVLPDIAAGDKDEDFAALEALAEQYGIPVGYLSAGMEWQDGAVRFLCLHPPAEISGLESNSYSQVLYLEQGDFSVLLTGDVEGTGEDMLMKQLTERGIGEVTVLKVAHHGSKYSTSEKFLEQVSPKVAVISCGADNSYGHPHAQTLERLWGVGSVVFTTPECGAVTVENGKSVVVRRFCVESD